MWEYWQSQNKKALCSVGPNYADLLYWKEDTKIIFIWLLYLGTIFTIYDNSGLCVQILFHDALVSVYTAIS